MPRLGLVNQYPLCSRPCVDAAGRRYSKPSCQNTMEQVRVGQPQVARGTCRAFWELEALAPRTLVSTDSAVIRWEASQRQRQPMCHTWEEVRLNT